MKIRLDHLLVKNGLVETRSQAENYIRLKKVTIDGRVADKPGFFVNETAEIKINLGERYVSRAGMKLASVAEILKVDFRGRVVLDVGSSTGGFTDFALQHGAQKVIAVDVGTNQLHPKLRVEPRVELHEKMDIRNFVTEQKIDTVVIDVSFISLREILPSVVKIAPRAEIIAMVKPQFEAGKGGAFNGVIKNNAYRRQILQDFEQWCRMNKLFIQSKRDSEVKGTKGNQERFYKLRAHQ